jgi:hypothetical protein
VIVAGCVLGQVADAGRHHGGAGGDRLVGLADYVLDGQDPTVASDYLRGMLDYARTRPGWHDYYLACFPHTSTALQAAIAAQPRPRRSKAPIRVRCPPRKRFRFGSRHVPQQPAVWVEQHFPGQLGLGSEVLCRITAVSLAAMAEDSGLAAAAETLGIRVAWQRSGRRELRALRSRPAESAVFMDGLAVIADELDARQNLIDYQRRRDALANWSIPDSDWRHLVVVLRSRQRRDAFQDAADCGDDLQRTASLLVWREVTCGDLAVAPGISADPVSRRQRENRAREVLQRVQADCGSWTLYRDLVDYLHIYATFLAAAIDRNRPPTRTAAD